MLYKMDLLLLRRSLSALNSTNGLTQRHDMNSCLQSTWFAPKCIVANNVFVFPQNSFNLIRITLPRFDHHHHSPLFDPRSVRVTLEAVVCQPRYHHFISLFLPHSTSSSPPSSRWRRRGELQSALSSAVGPISYKENQKHLISGIFVFLSHFIAFSAKKITAESRKRERSESVIKISISKGLG